MLYYFEGANISSQAVFGLSSGTRSEDEWTVQLKEKVSGLYDEMRGPLIRYLLRMRIAPEEAEEIVQETFLRLYKHLHSEGDEANLRGWIYRVAHNLASTRRKSRKFLVDTSEEDWNRISMSLRDSGSDPRDVLLHKEKLARLHRNICDLSELQQNCLRLRIEGFRYHEIARVLNVTSSTVAGSIRHAIRRLMQA